jgi:hypothetical protein
MDTVGGLTGKEQRLGEVIAAYLEAVDAGWAPPREELLAGYPDLWADLSTFFACQDEISRLALPPVPSPPSAPPAEPTGHRVETHDFRPGPDQTPTAPDRKVVLLEPAAEGLPALGDYELLEELRRGGMGVVYRARQKSLNRVVALKTMRAGPWATPAEVERFRAEAEKAASLDHPHVAPIYEVGEAHGVVFFSMKLFEGGSVADHLDRFPPDPRAAARLVAQVARAVHHAHQRGILHRDLKPANILLDKGGQPHVGDFGLAKRLAPAVEPPPAPGLTPPAANGAGLTEAGTVVGTPGYMSPEQAEGRKPLTTAADVYSLGAVLYKLLTGRPPCVGASAEQTLRLTREADPLSPRGANPRVDGRLEAVCLQSLRKDPEARYRSAEALAEDLERWLRGEPPLAWPLPWPRRAWRAVRRHLAVSAAVAAVAAWGAAVATFGLLASYHDPERPLHEAQARLARGEPAPLLRDAGPPAWYRWTEGEDATFVTGKADEPFALTTLAAGLLKLLPDPQTDRYRLTAEVRHDESADVSEVGVYFGFSTQEVEGGAAHYWLAVSFADRGRNAQTSWPRGQELKGPPEFSRVSLTVRRRLEPGGSHVTLVTPVFTTFPPALNKVPTPWRKLAVEVTRTRVRVFWEGQEVPGGISVDALNALVNKHMQPPGVANPAPFTFKPRGALGLLVSRGKASFRSVAVEPLR